MTTTHEPLHAQNYETSGNIEFLQLYATADTLFEIGAAVITNFVTRRALVTDKHFLCPEILLPVGVLLSYSVLPCQDTHC
jgi:hypothetical protein